MLKDHLTTTFLVVATIVIIATVAFGFFKLGSPAHQRDLRADQKRVNDLSTIAQNIYSFMNLPLKMNQSSTPATKLPDSLSALPQLYPQNLKDLVTGAPYEYVPRLGTTYELCATFATAVYLRGLQSEPYYGPRVFAEHPAGHYCFTLDAAQSPYETTVPGPKGSPAIPTVVPYR